jgi:hypothetical protein
MPPKKPIPAALRTSVWNNYVGINEGQDKCYCCNSEPITKANFECGHVISEKNGGATTLQNLRPICGHCNKSVNSKNLDTFMRQHGYYFRSGWNFVNKYEETMKINIDDTNYTQMNYVFICFTCHQNLFIPIGYLLETIKSCACGSNLIQIYRPCLNTCCIRNRHENGDIIMGSV